MEKRLIKNNWARSLLINTVIAAVILIMMPMVYETNDDFAIASRIVDGCPEFFFVNYYICKVMIWLQSLLPEWNVFVIWQMLLSFISFVSVLKIVFDRSEYLVVDFVAASMTALFSIDHYCKIQFTKTSTLVLAAAAIVLVDSLAKRRSWKYYVLGIFLMIMGATLRVDKSGAIAVVGFTGIYLLKWLIDNRSSLREYADKKTAVSLLTVLIALAGCHAFNAASDRVNTRTEALQDYVVYNELRYSVVDYPVLDHYEELADKYDEAGISENDVRLIQGWYFDYDGAASKENLTRIIKLTDDAGIEGISITKAFKKFVKDAISSIRNVNSAGVHMIILSVLALWMIFAVRPTGKLFVLAVGAATVVLHAYLFYIQRPAYRAMYVADICAVLYLLYDLAGIRDISRKKLMPGIAVGLIALAMFVPMKENTASSYNKAAGWIRADELTEYIKENDEKFFVIATREKKSSSDYLTPWKAPDTSTEKNFMGTGSWGTMSPYILDKMGAYGIRNPIKDLIDNENACYVGNNNIDRLTEYYNKWYGGSDKTIYLEQIDTRGGMNVWKVKTIKNIN